MKRLITLAIMAAFILGTAGMAKAAEFEVSGDFRVHANYITNPNFDSDEEIDKFNLYQRFRSNFNFIANENLKAVVQMQFGVDEKWGADERGDGQRYQAGGIRDDVAFRQAYLDFMIPNTEVNAKAGWQAFALPNTLGSHIFDARAPALTLTSPITDMVDVTVGYARSDDQNLWQPGDIEAPSRDERDHYFAVVPVSLDGVEVNPFLWYTTEGRNFGGNEQSRHIYFAGVNATIDMFDPIVVHADFNYGSAGRMNNDDREGQTRGWIANLAVDYNMDMMTPQVFVLYESGESRNSAGDDRRGQIMPTIAPDLTFTTFGHGGSQFVSSSPDNLNGYLVSAGPTGKWALGGKLMDISFIDDLTHEFQLAYYQGTNHRDSGLFSRRDHAWEANFNSQYDMYENLAAILELGYIAPDIDDADTDNAFKAAAGFRYQF